MIDYLELVNRNLGIVSHQEQDLIRKTRILIIGCGGVGGAVATCLARTGVENFILIDFDYFEPTNMNRQMGCTLPALGQKKSLVLADYLRSINPDIKIETYDHLLNHGEIDQLSQKADLVFPAADDLAFSIFAFRNAQRAGKSALLVVPSGTWATVSIITPFSPPVEDLFGIPKLSDYYELKDLLSLRAYKEKTEFYITQGSWQPQYHRQYVIQDNISPPQLCPVVWLASSLGAFEVIKYISHKWEPVTSPKYWEITPNHIMRCNLRRLSTATLTIWKRKLNWLLYKKFSAGRQRQYN